MFEPWDYQKQILADDSRRLVLMKCAQMGGTTVMMQDCLNRLVKYPHTKALWVAPTRDDINGFGGTRLPWFCKNQEIPFSSLSDFRFRIGDSFLVLRGGWQYRQAQMIDVDFLYFDEYDRIKPEVIELFQKRLSGSRFQIERIMGIPTLENKGIHKLFKESDQKQWFDSCQYCHTHQILWEQNLREDRFVCANAHCQAEIHPDRRMDGYWQTTVNRRASISGYHFSQFLPHPGTKTMGGMTADRIVWAREHMIPQDYQNLVLGLPVEAGDAV